MLAICVVTLLTKKKKETELTFAVSVPLTARDAMKSNSGSWHSLRLQGSVDQ
jgi:hypothetical protein